jgi:hypothetical protein
MASLTSIAVSLPPGGCRLARRSGQPLAAGVVRMVAAGVLVVPVVCRRCDVAVGVVSVVSVVVCDAVVVASPSARPSLGPRLRSNDRLAQRSPGRSG